MSNANLGYLYNKDFFVGIQLDQKEGNEVQIKSKIKEITQNRVWDEKDTYCLITIEGHQKNSFKLFTTYPGLLTGAGYEHEIHTKEELKLGFYFDFSSGMPLLPGSSVKGAIRAAFPNWGKHKNTPDYVKEAKTKLIWHWLNPKIEFDMINIYEDEELIKKKVIEIEEAIFEGLFQGKKLGHYQKDVFYDAIIVNPSNYVDTREQILGTDSITPHIKEGLSYAESMLKNPVPLPFLKILPGVQFQFQFDLKPNGLEVEKKIELFKAILKYNGIGAKTNVGYGNLVDINLTQKPVNNNSGELPPPPTPPAPPPVAPLANKLSSKETALF
ncbi:MAG: type III-B CRISPR module RAMP protein Cmr6, partial [bacterium]|nr:type III-B CRISPR module RAMP protein Cmr6 [bacterium]